MVMPTADNPALSAAELQLVGSVPTPVLDHMTDVVVENLKVDQSMMNTLDLDLLINHDQRISNSSYAQLLTALCHHWAHRAIKMEDELDLDEEQLVIVSKLFTRPATTATTTLLKSEDHQQDLVIAAEDGRQLASDNLAVQSNS